MVLAMAGDERGESESGFAWAEREDTGTSKTASRSMAAPTVWKRRKKGRRSHMLSVSASNSGQVAMAMRVSSEEDEPKTPVTWSNQASAGGGRRESSRMSPMLSITIDNRRRCWRGSGGVVVVGSGMWVSTHEDATFFGSGSTTFFPFTSLSSSSCSVSISEEEEASGWGQEVAGEIVCGEKDEETENGVRGGVRTVADAEEDEDEA